MSSARFTRRQLGPQHAASASSRYSRRTLLRGGIALGATVTGGLFAGGTALASGAGRSGVHAHDFPDAEWVPAAAENFQAADRPSEFPIDTVIVHVTQEVYANALKIFQDPAKEVSIHYLVRSNDGHVAQTVKEKDVAWHAGNSDFNHRSIGIEHEGYVDDPKWFTDELYASSAKVTAAACDAYGIPKDRKHIIGHVEVPGTDHTDPGPNWDWDKYMKLVNGG